ncbi:MAG: hypothetical protein ABSG17_12760 [Spirochaetia bacterium]
MSRQIALVCLLLALTVAAQGAAAEATEVTIPGSPFGTFPADVHSIVDSGHVGAVLDLQYDEQRNLLVSAGEDGTVRIWDAREGVLYRTLRVTRLAAQMIAIDPARPLVAAVVSDGLRSFFLSVWDWEREKQLLRLPLKDAPLFLRFSGQGSYIVYGESSWQGLKIIKTDTGEPVSFHPEGFGIVGFAEISRSEKTIMTYRVSGRISYWDLASGELTRDMPATPYLSRIRISRDRRFIIGNTGREAILLDTLSGAVRGRAAANGDMSLDISPDGDQVAGAPAAGGGPVAWNVAQDAMVRAPVNAPSDPATGQQAKFQVVCYGSDGVYLAGAGGAITALQPSGQVRVFGGNVLADVTGIAARKGILAVGSRDWIRLFHSDLLEGSRSPAYVRSVLLENPWKSGVALSFLSDTTLLAWTRDENAPRFAVLDLPDPAAIRSSPGSSPQPLRLRILPSGFHAPLLNLSSLGDALLGIENGGMVRVIDLATGSPHFEVRVPALAAAVASSPSELIGGKNTALAAGGSLVRINTRTGETVGIPGKNVFTWDLVFDPAGLPAGTPVLYSLGVDSTGATNLLLHDGAGFERETVIASDPDENLDASLALDPSTHVLYASLGRARVVAWDGAKVTAIPSEYTSLRDLLASDKLLISLDRDSALLVADQATGALLAELSLFSDGEWAAVVQGGGYLASPGGDAHVKVFVGGQRVKATEDYRLRIEGW